MNGASILAGSSTGAQQRSILQANDRYQPQFFAPPPPYRLTGPKPDKRQPDVWAVYQAATRAKYPILTYPGLVMQVGLAKYFDPYSQCLVFFRHTYKHQFAEATFPTLLIQSLPELLDWLKEHPYES